MKTLLITGKICNFICAGGTKQTFFLAQKPARRKPSDSPSNSHNAVSAVTRFWPRHGILHISLQLQTFASSKQENIFKSLGNIKTIKKNNIIFINTRYVTHALPHTSWLPSPKRARLPNSQRPAKIKSARLSPIASTVTPASGV